MTKSEILKRWTLLKPNQDAYRYFSPLKAGHRGSTYGACGVRIDGNPAFVDAILSKLKELIAGENADTRLTLSYAEVKPLELHGQAKNWENAEPDGVVCYVRINERNNPDPAGFYQARAMAHTIEKVERGEIQGIEAGQEIAIANQEEDERKEALL